MYKQNGSRDTCFEAVMVRVPWPDWIAELERTRYDNPKYVPVELVDATRGYDSECAVLFPEMVVGRRAAGRTTSGRSSATARPRGCGGSRARRPTCCRLNLPPDAARLLAEAGDRPSRPTSSGT